MIRRRVIAVPALASLVLWVVMVRMATRQLMPGDLILPESRILGYGQAEIDRYLAGLEPTAVGTYLGPFQTLDTIFPALLGLTLALGLLRAGRYWRWPLRLLLLLAPIGYGVADYGENALIAELLRGWPEPAEPGVAWLASAFTQAKFVLLGGALAIWLALGFAGHTKEVED